MSSSLSTRAYALSSSLRAISPPPRITLSRSHDGSSSRSQSSSGRSRSCVGPIIPEDSWERYPIEFRPASCSDETPPQDNWKRRAGRKFNEPTGTKKWVGAIFTSLKRSNSDQGPSSSRQALAPHDAMNPRESVQPPQRSRLIWLPSEETWLRCELPELMCGRWDVMTEEERLAYVMMGLAAKRGNGNNHGDVRRDEPGFDEPFEPPPCYVQSQWEAAAQRAGRVHTQYANQGSYPQYY
ncbi:MAG: hypothetical protein M1829_003468 [Trizodia sp. TS-e1964]|nr:MAG: hypothetical protein M1829_003468 [Trizodia sp. TS-e1964]